MRLSGGGATPAQVMTTQLFVDKLSLVSPLTAALFGAPLRAPPQIPEGCCGCYGVSARHY
jgi:hypothetical protein